MEDLTARQIRESCKLALPEGLKDLMSDISREVLRAQPEDLYKYIADYLSALLVTREHLSIACRLCGDICENICHLALVDELKNIGFDDEDAESAAEIVVKYFEKGGSHEDKLMLKIIKDTNIEEHQLPEVQSAIQNVFLRQKMKNFNKAHEVLSDSQLDPITRAVNHTMKIYESTEPTEHQQCVMAGKIQAAYKGYAVRRHLTTKPTSLPNSRDSDVQKQGKAASIKWGMKSDSSVSIAGSFMKLPSHKPYNIAESTYEDVSMEKEHANIDYTLTDPVNADVEKKHMFVAKQSSGERQRKIKFHPKADDPLEAIEDEANYADDESNDSVVDETDVAVDYEEDTKEQKDSLNDDLGDGNEVNDNEDVTGDDRPFGNIYDPKEFESSFNYDNLGEYNDVNDKEEETEVDRPVENYYNYGSSYFTETTNNNAEENIEDEDDFNDTSPMESKSSVGYDVK